jgi:phosphatidylglycerophosphate synthase
MRTAAWRLPDQPLRGAALTAVAAALLAVTAAAAAFRAVLPLGVWFLVRPALVLVLGAVLAAPSLGRHHPFPRLGAANLVTLGRAGLVALLVGLAPEAPSAMLALLAVGLAGAAIALDGVDGRLARRNGTASAFGARFDMEVDAALMLVLAVLVWRHGQAGAWVHVAGLLRYGFVAAGVSAAWLRRLLPPSRRRQAACVAPLIGLVAALAPFVPPPVSTMLAAAATGLVGWSFAVDVAWLARRRARA